VGKLDSSDIALVEMLQRLGKRSEDKVGWRMPDRWSHDSAVQT
jgi:hypothetical protein